MEPDTRYLLFQPFQCPCASFFNNPLPEAKASAKIQPFSKLPKKIFARKHSKAAQPLICNDLKQEKNFKKVTQEAENSPQKERETRRQTQNRHKQAQNSAKTELLTEIQKVKALKHPKNRHITAPFSTAGAECPDSRLFDSATQNTTRLFDSATHPQNGQKKLSI